jgi:hypothetical protein
MLPPDSIGLIACAAAVLVAALFARFARPRSKEKRP